MALVTRGNRHYLVISFRRLDGRVSSRCLATGEEAVRLGRLMEATDPRRDRYARWERLVERREREQADRIAEAEEAKAKADAEAVREKERAFEATIKGVADEVKELGKVVMIACGFHQHRWTWRKKRGVEMQDIVEGIKKALEEEMVRRGMAPPTPEETEKARAEIAHKRTPKGIKETVDSWESYDATRPEGTLSAIGAMTKVFHADPSGAVTELLLERWSGEPLIRELLGRQMEREKAALLGDNPTAIERQIVEQDDDLLAGCSLERPTGHPTGLGSGLHPGGARPPREVARPVPPPAPRLPADPGDGPLPGGADPQALAGAAKRIRLQRRSNRRGGRPRQADRGLATDHRRARQIPRDRRRARDANS